MKIAAAVGLAATFVALGGAAASAHVTVQPNTAEQGARGRFVFRVPNESSTASTIGLAVEIPDGTKLAAAGLRVQEKPGWSVTTEKTKLDPPIKGESSDITEYVSKITWTNTDPAFKIGPDRFDEFAFTTGPLPKDKTVIAFKALQTYDGPPSESSPDTVVRWVEERKEGQDDPRRPEAIVRLTPPTTSATGGATPAAASASEDASAATLATDAKDSASTARNIGILGLIVGIVALLAALFTVTKKPAAAPSSGSSATSSDS